MSKTSHTSDERLIFCTWWSVRSECLLPFRFFSDRPCTKITLLSSRWHFRWVNKKWLNTAGHISRVIQLPEKRTRSVCCLAISVPWQVTPCAAPVSQGECQLEGQGAFVGWPGLNPNWKCRHWTTLHTPPSSPTSLLTPNIRISSQWRRKNCLHSKGYFWKMKIGPSA